MYSRRGEIIKEAGLLFSKKGYSSTSMQDIADSLGIKAASLYNHISSKQEILTELLLDAAKSFVDGMKQINHAQISPLDKLKRIIALHVKMATNHPNQMSLMVEDWRNLDITGKTNYLAFRDSYEDDFKKILHACIEQAYFDDIHLELALFSILSTLRWTHIWHLKHPELSAIDLEILLQKYLIEGFLKK